MGFIEMWQKADEIDALIGGVDSIPENELYDYVEACKMALAEDFEYGQIVKRRKEMDSILSEDRSGLFYPPQYTEGGVRLSHTPEKEEMEKCAYAKKAKAECPRKRGKKQLIVGGPAPLINCATCPYHPGNTPIK